jgi:hypothetical protein
MKREEAIKLANEMAFMACIWVDDEGNEINDLVKFAKLVAAKEREACAELVENFEYQDKTGRHDVFFLLPHEHVAKAIRARGEA